LYLNNGLDEARSVDLDQENPKIPQTDGGSGGGGGGGGVRVRRRRRDGEWLRTAEGE